MRTAALFCFVGAFLFDPTLGLIWFLTDNPTRTDEYAASDLSTMFRLISTDLTMNRLVILGVPPTSFVPPLNASIAFSVDIQGGYLNGYSERTGRPNRYSFNGRFFFLNVAQGLIRVLRLETREELYAGVTSLSLNMIFQIDVIHIQSRIGYSGSWRGWTWATGDGLFLGHFTNVEIQYQTRFILIREGSSQILGQPMGEPVIAVISATINAVDVSIGNTGNIYDWRAGDRGINSHMDNVIESLTPALLTRVVSVIDSLVRGAFDTRVYTVPQITLDTSAADISGYSCRRSPSRESRATKL